MRMHKQYVPGLSLGGGAWQQVWIPAGLIYDLEVVMVSLISMHVTRNIAPNT